jgi:maltooligosyltrehalose trehalohydrolase
MTHEFRVWAPTPRRVELVVASGISEMSTVEMCNVEMRKADGGWWSLTLDHAGPGTRYGFSLDGGPPRPDPRSASQPDGTDGLSEVVDHTSFEWTERGWRGVSLRGAVLYELHVGTFTPTGTFDAAIERIPHLVELGIDAIELLPVVEFSGTRGWGYDGVDLFAPHNVYGGPDGLKRLIDACHRHGIGVVLDVVYNHVGPAGNRLGEFGPYFSERHRTNWGDAVNFDGPGSDEVRRFVIDNALMWLHDYHVDGLRLDAVHAIVDESARHVLEEIAAEVDALAVHVRRPLFLIAECDLNDPRFVRSRDAGGYGFASAWADEWHHALHAALTNDRTGYYEDFGTLAALAKALRQAWVYDGIWSQHRQRHHGRSPSGLAGHQFVVCTQNHDQVGNRAAGERSSALMSGGRMRVAAALLLAGPFTPMLFHGEEWGAITPFQYFTDHRDPDLAAAVSRGRRDEFANLGWDPDDVPDPQELETFDRSKLDWHEIDDAAHAAVLAWYRELIALRRQIPALSDPRLDRIQVDVDENRATIVVTRGPVKVIVNLGVADHHFGFSAGSDARLLAVSDPCVRADDTSIVVPPDAVAVVQVGDA